MTGTGERPLEPQAETYCRHPVLLPARIDQRLASPRAAVADEMAADREEPDSEREIVLLGDRHPRDAFVGDRPRLDQPVGIVRSPRRRGWRALLGKGRRGDQQTGNSGETRPWRRHGPLQLPPRSVKRPVGMNGSRSEIKRPLTPRAEPPPACGRIRAKMKLRRRCAIGPWPDPVRAGRPARL